VREVNEEVPALVVERHRPTIEEPEPAAPAESKIETAQPFARGAGANQPTAVCRSGFDCAGTGWSRVSGFNLRRQAPPSAGIRSVAVLPLQSLREDETDKTIALGLTDTAGYPVSAAYVQ